MTKSYMGTIEFESPINLDYSYGTRNVSERAKSTIDIEIREDGTGWFSWDIPDLDMGAEGELIFKGNTLVDYDGVFELPRQLVEHLLKQGYEMGDATLD